MKEKIRIVKKSLTNEPTACLLCKSVAAFSFSLVLDTWFTALKKDSSGRGKSTNPKQSHSPEWLSGLLGQLPTTISQSKCVPWEHGCSPVA